MLAALASLFPIVKYGGIPVRFQVGLHVENSRKLSKRAKQYGLVPVGFQVGPHEEPSEKNPDILECATCIILVAEKGLVEKVCFLLQITMCSVTQHWVQFVCIANSPVSEVLAKQTLGYSEKKEIYIYIFFFLVRRLTGGNM